MKKTNSTVPLALSAVTMRDAGVTLSVDDVDILFRRMLDESRDIQQAGILANQAVNCTEKTKFSNAAARNLSLPTLPSVERLQKFNVKAMDASEVHRMLTVWQKRSALASYLMSTNWTATFAETVTAFRWVDYQLYENMKRSQAIPALPKIMNVRIPVSKSAAQFCGLPILEGQNLTLPRFALWDREVNLHFIIPQKLLVLHPNITKITRPTIFLKNGAVTFDFTFEEPIAPESQRCDSVVGLDIGKTKILSAARVYTDGRISEELISSVHTERHLERIEKLDRQIALVAAKRIRRDVFGVVNRNAAAHELALRNKRKRTKSTADWSAASDVWSHVNTGETLIAEKIKFNTGQNHFRSSLLMKIQHVGNRTRRNLTQVNPAYSSQTCPSCQIRSKANKKRILTCGDCDWSEDRDYTAAVEIGLRGLSTKRPKLSRTKNRPTPKRPKEITRRRNFSGQNKTIRSAFTGAVSTLVTGNFTPAALVTSAIVPVNLSVILKT